MFTTTCMTCNTTTATEGPWNDTVVWCDECVTRIHATRTEILRLKKLQADGNLMAGMGVRPWDRERGAATAHRAHKALVELMRSVSLDDLAYIRDLESVAA